MITLLDDDQMITLLHDQKSTFVDDQMITLLDDQ